MTTLALDSAAIAWRNLLTLRRTPGSVFAAVLQPIMFVLLLGYVFGGSLGGDAYREFLMAGIFAQTVTFNASFTTIGLANDLQKGMIDRFRALPMSRVAVLLGRTTSDLTTSALSLLVTSLCGLAIGWAPRGGVLDTVVAYLLLLLFAFTMSWVGTFIGLTARSVEVAQSMGLIWLFPATFVSSGFVSVTGMPAPLSTIAEWNPITALANATRGLFANPVPPGLPQPHGWPSAHPTLYLVLTTVALLALFMTLSARRYRAIARH